MKREKPSGQQLVADFQTAFVAVATAQVAKQEADRSENELMQQLAYWSRSGFLQPGTIDTNQQPDVSRASLDAHIKKIQATQVDDMKSFHIEELSQNAINQFKGNKVSVGVLPGAQSPIDVLWFNPNSGYRSNIFNKQHITGTIEEIVLDKNILLIKPTRLPRLINKELAAYVVYVIDPATAQPAVNISFI